MKRTLLALAAIVLAVSSTAIWFVSAAAAPAGPQAAPVEKDMHEFMEYVFEPTYKRLKTAMAAAPADNAGWKGIKSDALILAEGGNLLLVRTPAENGPAWNELSAIVRDLGGKLYQSAKAKDYPSARQNYEAMLLKCNACHDKFAEGEHQLMP